jgi:hypothetical protein
MDHAPGTDHVPSSRHWRGSGVRRAVAMLAVDGRGGREADHAGLVVGVGVVHAPVARRRQVLADHFGAAGDMPRPGERPVSRSGWGHRRRRGGFRVVQFPRWTPRWGDPLITIYRIDSDGTMLNESLL